LAFISAFVFLSVSLPSGADAFFSFSSLFGGTEKKVATSSIIQNSKNSQTLKLLKANFNPNANSTGGAEFLANKATLHPSKNPKGDFDYIPTTKNDRIRIYVVRKGDTLSEIAKMFDVSVNTIRWANDLRKNEAIRPGQELVILPINGVKYTVKRGGTLRDIVKKIGGNIEEAAEINGIDPDQELKKGTVVLIPDAEIKESKSKVSRTRKLVRSYGKGLPVYKGYYMRPIRGGVRTQALHGHNAVDIAAPVGTAIYAAADGKVILSKYGWNGGYGNYIVIAHPNGTQTLYAHNSKNLVSKGDYVKQGQVIATVGSTGRSTGPHVHFEVRGAKNPF